MNALIFKILRFTGLPFLFRELVQRNKVTILLYHDIGKEAFAKNLVYLSGRYNIIGLDDFINACRKNDATALPEKALMITFDDGHLGNYELRQVLENTRIRSLFSCAPASSIPTGITGLPTGIRKFRNPTSNASATGKNWNYWKKQVLPPKRNSPSPRPS